MSNSTSLAGLTFVVTGGAGALGTAVVGELLARGAACRVPCHNDAELERFEHRHHPRVETRSRVDLSEEGAVAELYRGLGELWGSIHIAGGFAMSKIAGTALEDFRKQIDMNLVTAFLCTREAVKAMRRGAKKEGRVVNVAARPALEPRQGAGMAAYTASKAGVAAMTQALAEELAAERIWVNAVAPSVMDTAANRAAMPDADHDRWPKVEEVAATVVFLASPENACTRGAVVPVYGGA